jgi:phosphoglycerol transferase
MNENSVSHWSRKTATDPPTPNSGGVGLRPAIRDSTPTPPELGVGGPIVYGAALALCLGILTLLLQLWRADLRVPFTYDGDALLSGLLVKGIGENGWYLKNPHLGAPAGLAFYDYPMGDVLHFGTLRVLTLFCSQYSLALNLFYLLSFPATTLTALFVFRRFGFAAPPAVVGSLLYTFLPYHFLRGEVHFFLAMYYLVPLMVLVLLWVGEGERLSRPRLAASLAVCVLMSFGGVYYAAFACLLLLAAGGMAALRASQLAPMALPAGLIGVILIGSVLTLVPNAIYWRVHGKNPQVAHRVASESELYGLTISQLVLPITGHRIEALAAGKAEYNGSMLLVTENDEASLGLVGTLGFLVLLGCLLLRDRTALPTGLDRLASLNLAAVLLATIGGFGSLIAVTLTPSIRGYNRISVFIAFFALFAVVACLDTWGRRFHAQGRPRFVWPTLLGVLLTIGLYDQTSAAYVPDYSGVRAEFDSDARFVGQIETQAPQGRIFQLPYVSFPESSPVYSMMDYEQMRGYLHSKTLFWSYAAIRGRAGDAWIHKVAALPPAQMVPALRSKGFAGVWIDKDGYKDRGLGIQATFSQLLGEKPLVSGDSHLLFFRL